MSDLDAVFEAMRRTEMNDWVGGSDPHLVGLFCDHVLRRVSTIGPRSRVIDFGCGIGRVAAYVLAREQPPRGFLGIDIMPPVIEFCRAELQPHFPKAVFELAEGANDHYDRYIDDAIPARSLDALTAQYGTRFTHAYAFSVFTHLYAADFVAALRFVGSLLGTRGEFLFTAFTLTDFARQRIADRSTDFPVEQHEYLEGGRVLIGNPADPLAFIAYDRDLIEAMVAEAGLVLTKSEYGTWMGGKLGESFQDVYVCRKPFRPHGTTTDQDQP